MCQNVKFPHKLELIQQISYFEMFKQLSRVALLKVNGQILFENRLLGLVK